jgi:hypothetical protein
MRERKQQKIDNETGCREKKDGSNRHTIVYLTKHGEDSAGDEEE